MFNLECQILSFWWVVILSSERKNIGEKKKFLSFPFLYHKDLKTPRYLSPCKAKGSGDTVRC